jgi:L-2-hydroxyglutarate oxidase LhgO
MRPGADRPYDVTVVGGGLMGLATAYRLLEAKPSLRLAVLKVRPTGVRAQCMSAKGKLVEDFLLEEADGVLHVLNAPSPGGTASLAIGRMLAKRRPPRSGCGSGRDWDRTSDLPRVKRALSR